MAGTSLAESVLQLLGTIVEALPHIKSLDQKEADAALSLAARACGEMQYVAEKRATQSDAARLRELGRKNAQAILMPEARRGQ